jgi:hypothetical protein
LPGCRAIKGTEAFFAGLCQAGCAVEQSLRSFLKRDQIAIGLFLIIDALRAQLKEART